MLLLDSEGSRHHSVELDGDRVIVREAGDAEIFRVHARGLEHSVQAEVLQAVRVQIVPDLLDRHVRKVRHGTSSSKPSNSVVSLGKQG